MKKIKFLFITLLMLITLNSLNVYVSAEDTVEETTVEAGEVELTEEEILSQKQEILSSINSYLDTIATDLEDIDAKIENTKAQEEFEYYPAIRLNIDTPMFGMTSIVENKLKITKDVATVDVANKYSIRDVVENRSIRLADTYIAGIVVGTREVSIDENMTLPELKLTLVKCIQYQSQVNSVEEFIDTQINKTFRDYIAQEKKENIKDIKERTAKVRENLEDISDKISQMNFIGIDTTEYVTLYNSASNELYTIDKQSKNTLMPTSDLTELMKASLNNESTVLDIKTKVDEAYQSAMTNMDYLTVLNAFNTSYEAKYERMKKYIDASTTEEKKIENDTETTTTKQNYSVVSQTTLDYILTLQKEVETMINTYEESLKTDENVENETQTENQETETTTEEQVDEKELYQKNKDKIDELYNDYQAMLNKEYKFYTNNINTLLKDSNSKMTTIIGQIDSGITIANDIFSYTKYIYIDLPNNLSKYLEENDLDSTIELNNLIDKLYTELNSLTNTNIDINTMYNKMAEDILKS